MASSQAAPAALPQPSFAGLGRRLAAYFVDVAISACMLFAAGFTMRALRAFGLWTPAIQRASPHELWMSLQAAAKLSIIFGFVLSMGPIYLTLFEASPWQASFGKRLVGIHVTDDDGRRISIARAFGRWFGKWFFNWFPLCFISLVTVAATKKHKALHDFVVRTVVVPGRPVPEGSLEAWRILAAFGIPFLYLLAMYRAVL